MVSMPYRALLSILLGSWLIGGCGADDPRTPNGYPRSYAKLLQQADQERSLVIWSAVDRSKTAPLLTAFRREHPRVAVTYLEISARALKDRFLASIAQGAPTPDLLWSSAMDLQIQLTNDGYAQAYASPEAGALPRWANWKNEAWGITAEPIVIIYNRHLIADAAMPQTRAALSRLLEARSPALRDKVATYDLDQSAVGDLYLMQDKQASPDLWRLVRAMGSNGTRFYPDAEHIMRAVQRGNAAIGYNVLGSYARDEAQHDPNLGIVLPSDYTLVMSRIALIPKAAPHPAAAKLFVDFLLSRTGQRFLVAHAMPSVRTDSASPRDLPSSYGSPLRAIRVGPALLVDRDRLTHRYFLKRWHIAYCAGAAAGDRRDIMAGPICRAQQPRRHATW